MLPPVELLLSGAVASLAPYLYVLIALLCQVIIPNASPSGLAI